MISYRFKFLMFLLNAILNTDIFRLGMPTSESVEDAMLARHIDEEWSVIL
jgi:hypothetical protein